MREELDNTDDTRFEQILAGAQRSLWRFEQQRAYVVNDEAGLFAAFQRGELIEPTQAPGLRAWFGQVRELTSLPRGLRIGRVRIIDEPATEYQRWLQYVDRWNRAAGEEIHYLPRRIYKQYGANRRGQLWSPFGDADWWIIDDQLVLIMRRDAAGVRTCVEITDEPAEMADALQFRRHAENIARALERETTHRAA